MKKRMLLTMLTCLLLPSCSLSDDRDICCCSDTVRFRYLYEQTDRFHRYISKIRYFLFDGSGRFLRELPPKREDMATVDISGLGAGDYRLIAIGNLHDCGVLEGYLEEGLEAFRLVLTQKAEFDEGWLANGDKLYRGERDFSVDPGNTNYFIGEMANVHCELTVRVEWQYAAAYRDGYTFRLEGVGEEMEMNGNDATEIGVQKFPPVTGYGERLAEATRFRNGMLEAELVTLRWTDTRMPKFTLWHDGERASRTVDIGTVFRNWDIRPSRAQVQRYSITLRIMGDGSIEVSQGLGASVSDWEDGGTIG